MYDVGTYYVDTFVPTYIRLSTAWVANKLNQRIVKICKQKIRVLNSILYPN